MTLIGEEEPEVATVRSVAFLLPQFHPIPENDEWWGPGYTEWQRVARARPQFRGHAQPQLPADLGFYDLRLPEVRQAQAEMAATYRVDAFCYYYYWFSGRRLLHRPLDDVVRSGEPGMPFLICWANEPWTRAWDGHSREVLLDQRDDPDDAEAFARDVLPVLADDRYLTVAGRPLLLVYRATRLSDPRRATDIWRQVITAAGVAEPFLCRVESLPGEHEDPRSLGFDGSVEFQPDWVGVEQPRTPAGVLTSLRRRARSPKTFLRRHRTLAYEDIADRALDKVPPAHPWWRCVTPGWDNTARRATHATIVTGSTPERYEQWVVDAGRRAIVESEHPLLFVNAWNEWGEGCHLEPDQRDGHAYLHAHRRGILAAEAAALASRPFCG
jgi:lipopolysaccharide biosynthesis protein